MEELAAYFAATGHKIRKVWGVSDGGCGTWGYWAIWAGSVSPGLELPLGPKQLPLPALLQSEIEDMIWEVDEDCDQRVNWEEFQGMYERCRDDKTGACSRGEQKGAAV